MWQSRVEIEGYSVTYFNRIAAFKATYRGTSVMGGAHTCFVDARLSNESTNSKTSLRPVMSYNVTQPAVSEPHSSKSSVREPHTRNVNLS